MLEILGTLAGSIFSGGATGIAGVLVQRYADFKNKELDIQLEKQRGELDLAKKDKDIEIAKQDRAAKTEVATIEGNTATGVAAEQTLAASYQLEPKKYSGEQLTPGQNWVMVGLDAFRGFIRPALTLYLCILVTAVYVEARTQLQHEDLNADQALELFKLMLGTICYVWTTVTLWWFGTRNKGKQPG